MGNVNLAHKLLLLIADYNALREKKEKSARKDYDAAIVAASRAAFIQNAALGNERAGLWFASRSDENGQYWAKVYIERAHLDLEKRYPQILKRDASSLLEKTAEESASLSIWYGGLDKSALFGSTLKNSFSTQSEGRLAPTTTTFRAVAMFDPEAVDDTGKCRSAVRFFNGRSANNLS